MFNTRILDMKLNIDRIVCIGTYMKSNIMMFFLMQIQSGILNALETWDTICTVQQGTGCIDLSFS